MDICRTSNATGKVCASGLDGIEHQAAIVHVVALGISTWATTDSPRTITFRGTRQANHRHLARMAFLAASKGNSCLQQFLRCLLQLHWQNNTRKSSSTLARMDKCGSSPKRNKPSTTGTLTTSGPCIEQSRSGQTMCLESSATREKRPQAN